MQLIIKFWCFWLLPPKLYGGGGGGTSQVPQTNPEEQALAQISDEKWAEYKARYVPLENQWMGQVQRLNDPVYHNDASSLVSNELKAQRGQQTQNYGLGMAGQKQPTAEYLDQANDITQARTKASMGATDRYLKGLEGVIAMGQGQSADAIQGLSDVADSSVRAQIERNNNTFSAKQANNAVWGTAAGAAAGAAVNSKTIKKMGSKE